jgi:uncharacterized protein YecT (DUF1311 family)
MFEKIILAVIGAALGGIGVLALRWLRKDWIGEEIAHRQDTATLIANMRERGVTMADIEAVLTQVKPRRVLHAPPTTEELLEQQDYAEIAGAITQADMNEAQARCLTRLDRRMRAALEELGQRLSPDMRRLLERSQAAWEAYRDRMTDLAGVPWAGSNMRPIIEAGIQSRLTKQRAEELEAELADHRGEQDPAAWPRYLLS